MTKRKIETPLEEMDAPTLDGKKLALISILRAGNGLLDGVLDWSHQLGLDLLGYIEMKKLFSPYSITIKYLMD